MSFKTDKQTLHDLNIFGKQGNDSIFSLYNNTFTRGGSDILENMFLYPLSDADSINDRSLTIQYFSTLKVQFPIKTEFLDSAEIYLSMTDPRTKLVLDNNNLSGKFTRLISVDGDYQLIYKGVTAIIEILGSLLEFVDTVKLSARSTPFDKELQSLQNLLGEEEITGTINQGNPGRKLSYEQVVPYDNLFRFRISKKIKEILTCIYYLDVYMSIANVAAKKGYVFPTALNKERHTVRLSQLYHPLVKNAKANSIDITPEKNIVFLTGANMAGKSTFMKSLGIALYLAHMGFPVAASAMEFSIRDGIYTTINLPDDLSSGKSHFYAEVLRVKTVAKELGSSKNLFVIFDELFRGTNVKDAYDGTIAITEAFAQKTNSMFVVSTHIIEAGEVLKETCKNINFVYLPTLMENNVPVYTYRIESGITADRHGMIIINNEGILEIIRSKNKRTT
ncbi:MutS domain III [Pedobacter steynii]|uniref:MutS domain III n=1 Tax=Pedobacter steynii TaxID=430522 RepID=A0A1G9P5V8_9SPHI|nr:DNA mismatch repair protein [Pedobacter steynii]NQX39083.1 DNA mismatch repair protein [Pedobacter steynii]SDL94198.1 MutS domain III [Pedobacter steynii]